MNLLRTKLPKISAIKVNSAKMSSTVKRHIADTGLILAFGWLAVLVVFAIFAPYMGFLDNPHQLSRSRLETPGSAYWLGSDELGRDMFSRIVWGSRLSLLIALISTAFGVAAGGLLGLLAGYFKGIFDDIISGVVNIMLSLPALVFALFVVTVLEQSIRNVIIAVCLLSTPALARIARAQTIRFAQRDFVVAAKSMGAGHLRIIFREILPNVTPVLLSFAFLAFGVVIVAEGALSFIGKSVPSPSITWGSLLANARGRIDEASHLTIYPALAIFLTLLSANFIGDRLMRHSQTT